MKERPILFSAPMVRAILAGTKTQTRRALKTQPVWDDPERPDRWTWRGRRGIAAWGPKDHRPSICALHHGLLPECPYGQVGDRLWLREAWGAEFPEIRYRADSTAKYLEPDDPHRADLMRLYDKQRGDWRSSIFMPRWASRITLDITSVRVERLQDISEADALAEGACRFKDLLLGTPAANPCRWSMESPENTDQCLSTPYWAFANYFEKVNGSGSWDANPWVWVVEFRRQA